MELLLVLPFLLMLCFGVIDYGYYFYLQSTFRDAAQSGARAAISAKATNASVNGASGIVTTMLNAAGFPTSSYVVTTIPADVSTAMPGADVTVTITTDWGTVGTHALGTSFGGISNSTQIAVSATMVKEPS